MRSCWDGKTKLPVSFDTTLRSWWESNIEDKLQVAQEIQNNPVPAANFPRGALSGRSGNVPPFPGEAIVISHAKGDGPGIVHDHIAPREVREQAYLTQAQMAPLIGMSQSEYPKWEQGQRRISGPAASLLRLIHKEPDAVTRALLPSGTTEEGHTRRA